MPSKHSGFTLVEMLACVIVAGILAVSILSRLMDASAYDALLVRGQVIAMARAAQQRAIGHRDVVLRLADAGDELELRIEATRVDGSGTEVLQSARVPARQVTLGGDVNISESCGVQPAAPITTPMQLTFAFPGGLASGGVGAPVPVTHGARICIDDDPVMSVCVSSAGFAYAGTCDAED